MSDDFSFKINDESFNFINEENNLGINSSNATSFISYNISGGNRSIKVIKQMGSNNNDNFENLDSSPILDKFKKGINNFI